MKPTPESLVQAIQERERSLPWKQRPTRAETMAALLECHARAVAERDIQRAVDEAPPIDVEKFVKGMYSAAVAKALATAVFDIMDGLTPSDPSAEPR